MKSKQQTCLLLLNYFYTVCLWGIRQSSRRLAPQNSLQQKRDFLQKGDRLIEKIAKKQGKKTRDFHSPEIDALLTEKKKQLFALNLIVLIFIN